MNQLDEEIINLRCLLYEAVRELSYVQEAGCRSSLGKSIIERGIKLLGVPDLSADSLEASAMKEFGI